MANKDKIDIATALLDDFTAIKVKELIELRPWMKTKRFILLTKQREIEEYIDKCIEKGKCVYDLETNSLNTRLDENGECRAKIVGVCLSHDPDEGVYIPVAHTDAEEYNVSLNFVIRETKRLAANCVLIFHNFKYDGQILRAHGVVIDREDQYEDTYLMAAIQDASRKEKGLKYLSGALLDRPQLEIGDLGIQGTKKNTVAFYLVPPQKAVYYGGGDGMNTMAIYLYLKKKIDEMDPNGKGGPWAIYKVEKRCLFVTMEMERNLVKIDKDYLIKTNADVEQRMYKLISDIYKIAGHEFDINSTQQLGVVLFEELKIPYPTKALKTKTGHYQTNSEILEMVSTKNPIVNLILTYRGYVKIKSTYLFNWLNNADENDEVKFQLNQIQADTGRFSGSGGKGLYIDGYCGVNCQNIPTFDKKNPHAINLRRAMVAHHGFKMVSIDYSGEELRIATNFSKEPKWIQEFLHGTGDLHTITGKIITGKSDISKKERSLGKCVAKGTLIASEQGWVPIEELKEGNKVVTHNGTLKRVSKVHYMGIKPALTIESTTGYKITCGYNHQFLTSEDEWIRAEDLDINQGLRSVSCDKGDIKKGAVCNIPHDFKYDKIKSKEKCKKLELWDLTVEDDHTYVAQGFVTHNTVNFLTMYGGGAGGFAAQAKIPFETAKKMIINFFKEYSGLNSWIKREWKISRKRGYSKTALGRRRSLHEFYNSQDKGIQSKGDRCAINSAIQGCLQGHERILTDIGYLPILELYHMPNEILHKIKVWTGTSWETFDVMDRGEAQYAELELSNGMVLNCDVRHEVLVAGENGYEFRHFNDLDEETEVCVSIPSIKQFGSYPNDFVYEPKSHNGKSFSIRTKEQWDFIGYLMGYTIGDGNIRYGARGSLKGESYQVQINSKGLVDLFIKLGYIPSDSHGKRVPEIIYRVPVDMRKSFIQGYFDTDGCKKRRNRYGFHTPNVALLRDVQLIGWTLGLSSIVRDVKNGNYKLEWQDLKKVEDLLDIPSTEWKRRNVSNKMLLPEFMRKEVHSKLYPVYDRKNVRDCSYFCKINTGKLVSLPGMISMMDKYKCGLPNEMYYHYKLKRKTILHKKDHTYTLAVHSALHRFDSSGIISKNTAADILKIAMWRVYRWIYDNNLQDDVKILLPVHDEILYEVREEKMDMIIPELCRLMKIRDITDKLKWEVPFEVDAEYGDSFHVDHDYWKEMEEKMKDSTNQGCPSLEDSIEKPKVPEAPESVVAPENPETVEELEKPEAPERPEKPEIINTPVVVGTSSSGSMSYYHNLTINSGPENSGVVQNVLGKTEEKSGQTLFKDAHMEDHIDSEGFFNYTIDINLMSAHKLKFILETIRLGDNLFIGPKNKICLMSSDGDVFYRSKEEISIDSFLTLCMVLDV